MRLPLLLLSCGVLLAAADAGWIAGAGGAVGRDPKGEITSIDLRSSWVSDADLRDLAGLPHLATLNLSLTRITDRGLKELKSAPAVVDLDLRYAEQITDEGTSALKGWQHLKRLNLRGTKITDTTLDHLSGIPTLESLDIGFAQFTDSGLQNLALLPHLKELAIGGNKLSDVGLQFLRQVPGLTSLDVSGSQRTDSGLWSVSMTEAAIDSIATLRNLQELRLGGSPASSRWLEKMKGLKKLERLSLQDSRRLGNDGSVVLATFTGLRWLDLKGTSMTAQAVAELRKQLPQCEIVY
jgi:internalin A